MSEKTLQNRLLFEIISIYLKLFPVTYQTRRCIDLTELEYKKCSDLFSNHYGIYNNSDPNNKGGNRIRMSGPFYIRSYRNRNNAFVTLAYAGKLLIGQAFFISDDVDGKGRCTWVTQLVVHSLFRRRMFASRLLQSAWGFSDDYAWGLATVNPMAIKVLESSTFRALNLESILDEIALIQSFQKKVPFAEGRDLLIDNSQSVIDSKFFPIKEHEETKEFNHYQKILGPIPTGAEWIAFTFHSQPIIYDSKKWEGFMKFQESQLIDSYSRMNIPMHKWASGSKEEVTYILDYLVNVTNTPITSKSRVLDLGCGTGRHLNTLLKLQSVKKAVGIDFSKANISKAKQGTSGMRETPEYRVHDVRKYWSTSLYDVVLCLYDVVGSYREERDNERIIMSIKRNLKKGGHAFISVMNMDYTEHVALFKDSLRNNPDALLSLSPSENMAKTGDVFNPHFFIINTDDGLVYRKEQFRDKKGRDAEYLIADKRYTMTEMKGKLENHGLKVIDSKYVRVNHWKEAYGATEAKEILFVVTK